MPTVKAERDPLPPINKFIIELSVNEVSALTDNPNVAYFKQSSILRDIITQIQDIQRDGK